MMVEGERMLENGGTEGTWSLNVPVEAVLVDGCNMCGSLVARGIAAEGPFRGERYAVLHERTCRRDPAVLQRGSLLFPTGPPGAEDADR